MNERQQTKFEERLNQIIGAEPDVGAVLDELEDEGVKNLPAVVEYDDVKSAVVACPDKPSDLVDDYMYTRKILYGLINRGTVALEGALMIARESEHPRAFEVSANIMKGVAELTRDLMELQKTMNGGAAKSQSIGKQVNIQNNFNGVVPDNDPKDVSAMLDGLDD